MKHPILNTVLIIVFVIFVSFLFSNSVNAQMPTKMFGYAWAPNFGWVNFGTANASNVTVNASGVFSGFGWSPNLGWIRIDPTLTGPAEKGDNWGITALPDGANYKISGWMRACSAYVNPSLCSGEEKLVTGTERGGWDGWFKMKDVIYSPATYSYTGHSWGDLVGGWVGFGTKSIVAPITACVPATDLNHCCPTGSAWDGTVCSTVCNPAIETCGGGGGGGFSASCTVTPAVGDALLTNFTWTANPINGSGSYSYKWWEKNGSQPYSVNPISGEVSRVIADKKYTAGSWYRKVEIKDTSNGNTATADCLNVNVPATNGITVTDNGCKLNILTSGGLLSSILLNNVVALGSNTVDCNATNRLATTTPTSPAFKWKDGSCSATNFVNPLNLVVTTLNSPRTVCADFGGIGEIIITGGLGSTRNLVRVDKPSSYPVYSTPVAKISALAGSSVSVSVLDWGGLGAVAKSCSSKPSLCIGSDVYNTTNCIEVGDISKSLIVDSNAKTLKLYFPNKCPGSSGISVFHKPAGYWNIVLSGGGVSKNLILDFNDPSSSNR